MGKKVMVKFPCFFCGKEVNLYVTGRYQIKKVHCKTDNKCKKKYKDIVHRVVKIKKYVQYRRKIQARLRNRMETLIVKSFLRRDKKIFFINTLAFYGNIIKEDESHVIVEEQLGGHKRLLSKACIVCEADRISSASFFVL